MQKCGDSGFCKRLRGNSGEAYEVEAKSVSVKAAELRARLVNTVAQKELQLALKAYDGFVRLSIDEQDSKRFQVDLIAEKEERQDNDLAHRRLSWLHQISCTTAT